MVSGSALIPLGPTELPIVSALILAKGTINDDVNVAKAVELNLS